MAEDAKNVRRSAKARFTRKRNDLINAINENKGIEVIEDNYAQLVEAWNLLEGKHDLYLMYVSDDDMEDADKWMADQQNLYTDVKTAKIRYVNIAKETESRARAQVSNEETKRKEREQIERMVEHALIKRENTRTVFGNLCNNIDHVMRSENITTSLVKNFQKQLETTYSDCCKMQDNLLELLSRESAGREMKWLVDIQTRYHELTQIIELYRSDNESKDVKPVNAALGGSNIRLEKVKMPYFEGEMRDYPQFKRDFLTQVMPTLTEVTAPYTLRSCLGIKVKAHVKSVDDDIYEMWKRLDEKFGDPTKVTDAIINDIKRYKVIREGENRKFLEFVDMIEDSYRDLKRLNLEKEITTTSSVSIIESKLPHDIRKEWAKFISSGDDHVIKADKFDILLDFLLKQKRAIEYDTADLRNGGISYIKGSTNHIEGNQTTRSRCLCHEQARHETHECKSYLSKSVPERKEIVKNKRACWSCLKVGHRLYRCRRKNECGINGCKEQHQIP